MNGCFNFSWWLIKLYLDNQRNFILLISQIEKNFLNFILIIKNFISQPLLISSPRALRPETETQDKMLQTRPKTTPKVIMMTTCFTWRETGMKMAKIKNLNFWKCLEIFGKWPHLGRANFAWPYISSSSAPCILFLSLYTSLGLVISIFHNLLQMYTSLGLVHLSGSVWTSLGSAASACEPQVVGGMRPRENNLRTRNLSPPS